LFSVFGKMKVVVKILQGDECVIELSPTDSVLTLKSKVRDLLGIDTSLQKLILLGKALADENPLSFYPGIKEGCRLYLVVKKEAQTSSQAKPANSKSGTALLKEEMSRVLRHYYTPSETESIVNELMKDLRKKVDGLSFDDLERLATALLQDQENTP